MKRLVYLWPLAAGWPIIWMWRGPAEKYAAPAPYEIHGIKFQNRDSAEARDLVEGLKGRPVKLALKGCSHAGRLSRACKKTVFTYLLCWQGDPLPVKTMYQVLKKNKSDIERLQAACRDFSMPSSLTNAGEHADQLWIQLCSRISADGVGE